jgi:hypothetical protein
VNTKILDVLPPFYVLHRKLDLSQNRWLLIGLNIAGLILLIPFGLFFTRITALLRPSDFSLSGHLHSYSTISYVIVLIMIITIFIILHEIVHGLFFWFFTHKPPKFGFKGAYAYAAAPGWYIPRNPYLLIGISPLMVISAAGIVLLAILPADLLFPLELGLIFNAIGSVGDLFVTLWLLARPSTDYIEDQGDAILIFTICNSP